MRKAVADVWFDFSVGHEGFTPFPYADTLNLVTTGIGNKIDDGPPNSFVVNAQVMRPALVLPWRLRGPGWTSKNPVAGALVSPSEVADAWQKVKLMEQQSPGFSQQGGFKYAGLTSITLDMAGIKQLFSTVTAEMNAAMVKSFPRFEQLPADAQLAAMSMAWAMGENFAGKFPAFTRALNSSDFVTAEKESFFKGGGALTDSTSRNFQNALMFRNAEVVQKAGADFDLLWFPAKANPIGFSPSLGVASIAGKVGKDVGIAAAIGAAGWFGWKMWKGRKR